RAEVACPATLAIDDVDRNAGGDDAAPGGFNQDLALEYEAARAVGTHIRRLQQPCRIDAESGLGVRDPVSARKADPEVRDPVRPVARGRDPVAMVQARADHDASRHRAAGLQ